MQVDTRRVGNPLIHKGWHSLGREPFEMKELCDEGHREEALAGGLALYASLCPRAPQLAEDKTGWKPSGQPRHALSCAQSTIIC